MGLELPPHTTPDLGIERRSTEEGPIAVKAHAFGYADGDTCPC
jgi:hypothetical protein